MIKVKFFGMINVKNNISQLEMNEGTVKEVIKQIIEKNPEIKAKELKEAVIFVNKKNITGNKRFSLKLKDKDEISFLTPSGGG
jgi:molybdopterin converting factor small subunit